MKYKIPIIILVTTLVSAPSTEYVFPPQNYKHWQKLQKICETGRKTYGANEFLEDGKVCRYTYVPYWSEKKEK